MPESFDRRTFVKIAGLSGAAAFASITAARDAKPKKWQMRLSTSSIHFMELPIEQACLRIAELGFEAIDIWSAHEGCPHLDDVATRLRAAGLKQVLEKHKLKLCGFSVYQGGYARYAELLGEAGGGVAIQGSAPPCETSELTSRMRQFLDGLRPLTELAEKYNSYLAIENHDGALLNTVDSLRAFVDLNRSPRLGIALAPYHLQAIKASVPEAIRLCDRQLFFFYAWQQQQGDKQLPGVGPTDMTAWVRALQDIRYRGYVNPFTHSHPGTHVMSVNLRTARRYLIDCYERITPQSESKKTG